MKTNTIDPSILLRRTLWLAYQASEPMGYGILHTGEANKQTEDSLWESCCNKACVNTDYVFGRMMKTTFEIGDGAVQVHPEIPRWDYQSWGRVYPTATALIEAAKASLQ